MRIAEAFLKAVDLALASGAKDIAKLPGCYEQAVDEQWWFAINGHDKPMTCSKGASVPEFAMYVMFNGWPAGIMAPSGGCIAAGSAANEDTFIFALEAATAKFQARP